MNKTLAGFLDDIIKEPRSRDLRLILADWLDDQPTTEPDSILYPTWASALRGHTLPSIDVSHGIFNTFFAKRLLNGLLAKTQIRREQETYQRNRLINTELLWYSVFSTATNLIQGSGRKYTRYRFVDGIPTVWCIADTTLWRMFGPRFVRLIPVEFVRFADRDPLFVASGVDSIGVLWSSWTTPMQPTNNVDRTELPVEWFHFMKEGSDESVDNSFIRRYDNLTNREDRRDHLRSYIEEGVGHHEPVEVALRNQLHNEIVTAYKDCSQAAIQWAWSEEREAEV